MRSQKLVESLQKEFPLDESVKSAFLKTNREHFINDGFKHLAHKLDALPIAGDQWISSPLTVAKMTQYLEPQGADSVLEIGLGSGYQAAILSVLIRRVFSIERIEKLLIEARERIKSAGIYNINTRLGDGCHGWRDFAPFDRILFSASIGEIPKELFSQLSEGGILLAPIQKGNEQVITRYKKNRGTIAKDELEKCLFVPVCEGVIAA